jgi:hypothetical protein
LRYRWRLTYRHAPLGELADGIAAQERLTMVTPRRAE